MSIFRSFQMADECASSIATNILRHWQFMLQRFENGLNGEQSQELLQSMRRIIDEWVQAIGPERLETLGAARESVMRVRAEAERMHVFLTRPRPPIDPVLLTRGCKEIAEGRYKTAEQIRSARPQ